MAIEITPDKVTNETIYINGLAVIWAGVWSNTKTYKKNQGVFYIDSSYRANKTTTQTPSISSTDWDSIALGGTGSSGNYIPLTDKGIALGVATLNSSGKISDGQIDDSITRDTELTTGLATKANQSTTYTKTETDTLLTNKANQSTTYTKTEVNTLISNYDTLNELGDVSLTSPTNSQVLAYNSTTSKWTNQTIGGGGSGETNTASNVGVGGVGVYKQKTGVNLEFRNVNAGSSKITVTNDTANNEIDIDIAEANLTLVNLGGTLSIAKGGTGSTTASSALGALGAAASSDLTTHTSNTSNPHSTTASQVGAIPTSARGTASGVASLDTNTLVPVAQIPSTIARVTDITATQVGNTTAQWNANKIQGTNVLSTAPTNGQILVYSSANSRWEPTTPSSSSGSSPILKQFSSGIGTETLMSVSSSSTYVSIPFTQIIFSPSTTSSKVLIRVSLGGIDFTSGKMKIALTRSNSSVGTLTIQETVIDSIDTTNKICNTVVYDFVDSPNTTLSTEYSIRVGNITSANCYINRNLNSYPQGYSSLTVLETT
ncbi:MAG: hypothetical protein V7K21_11575 [Nostoc sp.]|uniref:hypothetical protein n=1 Tax=Nostoc sp. TaxID=1180 RepID=UPI002FF6CCA4